MCDVQNGLIVFENLIFSLCTYRFCIQGLIACHVENSYSIHDSDHNAAPTRLVMLGSVFFPCLDRLAPAEPDPLARQVVRDPSRTLLELRCGPRCKEWRMDPLPAYSPPIELEILTHQNIVYITAALPCMLQSLYDVVVITGTILTH